MEGIQSIIEQKMLGWVDVLAESSALGEGKVIGGQLLLGKYLNTMPPGDWVFEIVLQQIQSEGLWVLLDWRLQFGTYSAAENVTEI